MSVENIENPTPAEADAAQSPAPVVEADKESPVSDDADQVVPESNSNTTADNAEAPAEDSQEPAKSEDEILDDEYERLLPGPGEPFQLVSGDWVSPRPLKMKELMAAFKVITRGAAMSMGALSYNLVMDSDNDELMETIIILLINAIPEAEQEVSELIRVLVDPLEPEEGWKNRDERHEAERRIDEQLLGNPEIEDALTILTVVLSGEMDDIKALGKKLRQATKLFSKVVPKN